MYLLFFQIGPACAQSDLDLQDSSVAHQADSTLMTHAFSRTLPMARNASGTAWLPDSSPMFLYLWGNQRSYFTLQGNVVVRYNRQDVLNQSSRGGKQIDVPTWFMGRYVVLVGNKGLLQSSVIISFDPFGIGQNGYPLLFQTGQTYNGNKLVDRQHPKELISGLSIGYTHQVGDKGDVSLYIGYPGEPALGPVSFMQRVSALNNPDAPLAHHWQDATRIVYGVVTGGVRYGKLKLEGSVFNGSNPNEDRYDFEPPRLNSYSYRLSYNPAPDYSLQFSQGFLEDPERLAPGNITRTTASVTRSKSLRMMNWSQTAAWGLNKKQEKSPQHSFLYENNLQSLYQAVYMRYEYVKKSAEDLNLETAFGDVTFNIHSLTVGYNRNVSPPAPVEILAGVQGTLNFPDADLKPVYGKTPLAVQAYLQFRPRRFRLH